MAGQTCELSVEIDIAEGFHLYGPKLGESLVQATTIDLAEVAGVSFGSIVAPDGKSQRDPVLGQVLQIYEGRIQFTVPVTVNASAGPGTVEIIASVAYQACDDRRCLLPRTAKLKRELVVADAKPVDR